MSDADRNHYVLVVHGIGRQRKNETVLSVVSRFAEARACGWNEEPSNELPIDSVTLGMASSQSDFVEDPHGSHAALPWLEFEGIPKTWHAKPPQEQDEDKLESSQGQEKKPPRFDGSVPRRPGENLRFVDVHWSRVLAQDFDTVGDSTPERWGTSLTKRLAEKDGAAPPPWAVETLRLLRETVVLARRVLLLRGKRDTSKLVFDEFLGDVQVYGEHPRTRGRAVAEFHRLVQRIEDADTGTLPPRYTVIAHSLGSVMSFDALMYAALRPEWREGAQTGPDNLPFPGYPPSVHLKNDQKRTKKRQQRPWIEGVQSFVTLGSPIDKYLVLWWNNYRYLTDRNKFRLLESRILHFNYCDEQDPVGHKLDLVESAPAYGCVFKKAEDTVFNRYAIPGAAHNQYWKDRHLFAWILRRAVDQKIPPTQEDTASEDRTFGVPRPSWFKVRIYRSVLQISYWIVPWISTFLLTFGLSALWFSEGWHQRIVLSAVLASLCILIVRLLDLSVWWRQVLVAKDEAIKLKTQAHLGRDLGAVMLALTMPLLRAFNGLGALLITKLAKAFNFALYDFEMRAPEPEPKPKKMGVEGEQTHRKEWRSRLGAQFRGLLSLACILSSCLTLSLGGSLLWSVATSKDLITPSDLTRVAVSLVVFGLTTFFWTRIFRANYVPWSKDPLARDTERGAPGARGITGSQKGRVQAAALWVLTVLVAGSLLAATLYPICEARLLLDSARDVVKGLRAPDAEHARSVTASSALVVALASLCSTFVFTYLFLAFRQAKKTLRGTSEVSFKTYILRTEGESPSSKGSLQRRPVEAATEALPHGETIERRRVDA